MSTAQEYDPQYTQPMLDRPDHDHVNTLDPSMNRLQGSYSPQYDDLQQPPQETGYYQQSFAMQHQQVASQASFDQSQVVQTGPTRAIGGISCSYEAMGHGIDPDEPMSDADPFGLSASMHHPTSYSSGEYQRYQR